jgi:hypothetical protein
MERLAGGIGKVVNYHDGVMGCCGREEGDECVGPDVAAASSYQDDRRR